jgi:hypothetical protein
VSRRFGAVASAVLLIGAAAWWLRTSIRRPAPPLEAGEPFPAFRLPAPGGAIDSRALAGSIWVASFARAGTPELLDAAIEMRSLEVSFERAPSVALVTFLDGASPSEAEEAARQVGSGGRWRVAAGSPLPGERRLLVVDRAGRIRARVSGHGPEALAAVREAVGALLR